MSTKEYTKALKQATQDFQPKWYEKIFGIFAAIFLCWGW